MRKCDKNDFSPIENCDEEVKITYRDGNETRAIRGQIIDEDNIFIHLKRRDSNLRINKTNILKIEGKGQGYGN